MNTPVYSFRWLASVMKNRSVVTIISNNTTYKGIINGIAVEDGSGNNWLLTMILYCGKRKTIFVKAD